MDWQDWAKMAFALIATLSLLGLTAYAARRFGWMNPTTRGARRMRVSESLMIDARRRVVLVRCDGREHMLLLSPSGDKVIAAMDAPQDMLADTSMGAGEDGEARA